MNWLFLVPSLLFFAVQVVPCRGQMIVAHRGASYDAPENTLAAFRLAWEQESDGIEGDFYLTADDRIVCIHDPDTQRTAGIKRIVEESSLAELRELEYGSWKDPRWHGEQIPTLRDVWETVPDGKLFVIELKSKESIAPVLADQLRTLDDGRIRVLIISFHQETAAACKALMPATRVHWLTKFSPDEAGVSFHPDVSTVAETIKRLGVEGVGMRAQREVIDLAFAQALKQMDCREFHVWTVDSIDDAKYFQTLGVMGITTNRPAHLRAAIKARQVVAQP
jgi:glycerophosphoryl diester phosphodiesterase